MNLEEYLQSIADKRVAVIGVGVSNAPLIELLTSHGIRVCACDKRSAQQMGDEAERLTALGVELHLGEGYLEGLDQDIIFRTPGLMPFEEHLAAAEARGSVLTSEMELFFALCPCRILAVTGSDGKTTTTTILSELLKEAGYRVHLGGNIGHPLLCELPNFRAEDLAVLELSSFQLHSMRCKPNVAVITNISPNHLDKHKDYQDYIDAKRSIFAQQGTDDRLILNAEDGHSAYYASTARAELAWFSDVSAQYNGAYCLNGKIWRVHKGEKRFIMASDEIKIPGEHNVQNYLAAFAATEGLVSDEVCRMVARRFPGVEHRLEEVRILRGVTYINDSIGTSPSRTAAGLRALKTKPIVIAGGYDKHIPFDSLGDELCLRAKRVILTGDTAEKIEAAILASSYYPQTKLPYTRIDDFREAVLAASAAAESGDIVLLSPACAAFDRFKNFAERGKIFKQIVMELT